VTAPRATAWPRAPTEPRRHRPRRPTPRHRSLAHACAPPLPAGLRAARSLAGLHAAAAPGPSCRQFGEVSHLPLAALRAARGSCSQTTKLGKVGWVGQLTWWVLGWLGVEY